MREVGHILRVIVSRLSTDACSRFRWVQCQVDHIKTLRTARDIKLALEKLPPDLDRTYDSILQRVPAADVDYLRRALQFVVFSARPLTVTEVAEAVIIEPGTSSIDEDAKLQRPEDLLEIGKSLFAQHDRGASDKRLLELSHYSVKEYLLSERTRGGPAAEVCLHETTAQIDIAIRCLTYLGLDDFESKWQDFDAHTWNQQSPSSAGIEASFLLKGHKERLTTYPFLDYAAKHCFTHCKDETVQKAVSSLVWTTLGERRWNFRNMTYTCAFQMNEDWETIYMRTFRWSLISVAARFGLTILVQDLLDRAVPVDFVSPNPPWVEIYPEGLTALYRAADFGHVHLCSVLIHAGASLEGIGNFDSPLAAAGRSGKPHIIRLMLQAGANVHRDTTAIALMILKTWWEYAEGDEDRRQVLEVFREAGAKWLTIGLLQAFSRVCAPIVRRATELLIDNPDFTSEEPSFSDVNTDIAHDAVETMGISSLTALQWLIRDDDGIEGLKHILKSLMKSLIRDRRQLFTSDSSSFAKKFETQEVLAENLIFIYFKRVVDEEPTPSESFRAMSHNELLAAPWDNKYSGDPIPFVEPGRAEKMLITENPIICGDIMRALIRGRWDWSYVNFYD